MSENARVPEEYVPPTEEERRRSALEMVRRGLSRMRGVKLAHTVDVKMRIDGNETWHEGDWLKYLDVAFPELREREGSSTSLPPGYGHHPGLASGPYTDGHVVTRTVEGSHESMARIVWMAVGRDAAHAFRLAWQDHEGVDLVNPIAVWYASVDDRVSPRW